jgi:cobalamin synthase
MKGATGKLLLANLMMTLGGAAALLWPWGLFTGVLGLGVALVWGALFARRLGGLTGDGLGGAVELAELASLLCIASLHHLGII